MYSVNRRESGRHFHIDSDDKKNTVLKGIQVLNIISLHLLVTNHTAIKLILS